ncbi:glycosyltransferase [Streptomyces sp. NP160]|uniref:glycosyltransferase family 4 protein n=1 Tax=Streptomyces sp. NP160 TaxID=2586637 RepID=UPI001118909F|nr:glycosyltransferase family 4 protein [Streptomyces sp. NP160]TNM61083.1 glycosyltransferase [Streptomyces sp. NP160]
MRDDVTRRPVTSVFAVGRGQYENIGDLILRRQLMAWAAPAAQLHVYVGQSPEGYDEGLQLPADAVVYRSLGDWYRAALLAALRGPVAYLFKPGEIQLTLVGMKEHLVMLPLLAAIRLRGGRAVRAGVGSRGFAPLPRALLMPSVALSDLTLWRDVRTAEYLRVGELMPDLAFGEGAPDEVVAAAAERSPERDLLVVSVRGDERAPAYPGSGWVEGVRRYAAANGLRVWAVAQVDADDERAHRLAADLGGEVLGWSAGDHWQQEQRLRALYRRAALAVSDRLHVVVAAHTEGAVPVGSVTSGSDKIDRHYAAIGLHGITTDAGSATADEVVAALTAAEARREEAVARLLEARAALRERRSQVRRLLGVAADRLETESDRRPLVVHLGRTGDVPGGMVQVLNGYLAWPFERVRVAVITSRGAPHDLVAGGRAALGAVWQVLRLERRSTVVVGHLSTRGSFVREGLLLRLARRRGLATVAHLHGSTFAAFAARHPRLVRSVLRSADRVIALSEESRAVSAAVVPSQRVHVIPNAIAAGAPAVKEDLLVFGGVVDHRKGVDVLQEAWSRLDHRGWELVVAGPVPDESVLRRDLPGVRFAGALPHEELMDLLDRSRIAVLPSRGEAMPMFLLEAMARGNAVVSTSVGGVPELLAGGRGVVVPPGDPAALEAALDDLLRRPDAVDRLAAAALDGCAVDFSAESVFPRVEDLWLDALHGGSVR